MRDAINDLTVASEAFALLPALPDAGATSEDFSNRLDQYERLILTVNRLTVYAEMVWSVDVEDTTSRQFREEVAATTASAGAKLTGFRVWWQSLDQDEADRLAVVAGDRAWHLQELRGHAAHSLSERDELIVAMKDANGLRPLVSIYGSIKSRYATADLVEPTNSSDRMARHAAYKRFYQISAYEGPILEQIYQAIVNDWRSDYVELRGYASPLAASIEGSGLTDDVVHAVLSACRRNSSVFGPVFSRISHLLGVAPLQLYDLTAPLDDQTPAYTYSEAVAILLDSHRAFDARLGASATKIFDHRHAHAAFQERNRLGGYCWSAAPDLVPWIFFSYRGTYEDLSTKLAHETGHAIHHLAAADRGAIAHDIPAPLAEISSTFSQLIVSDYLLSRTSDPRTRERLLVTELMNLHQALIRQAYLALFEIEAHDLVRGGATLETICNAYLTLRREQFHDCVEVSDFFRWEWFNVRHFFEAPFYICAYPFGVLAAISIFEQCRQEGQVVKEAYLKLLESGASASAVELLDRAGFPVSQADFWDAAFQYVQRLATELEGIE